MIILNFQKTQVSSIKETLGLDADIKEVKVNDFFSDSVYLALKELDISAGGGD
ncbi:hypothetical protein [Helicobacter sp. WB40]|uniref:hypothetical protein n=1 Tax=Helicobacter sp. WB40 TaxID=3004130 RepID=UPI0022EC0B56|nr:hypothetical protein [Helicobacter sp. WB40]MDA3967557.1 hypothetical protein [Helicobacter sp. WB40]